MHYISAILQTVLKAKLEDKEGLVVQSLVRPPPPPLKPPNKERRSSPYPYSNISYSQLDKELTA